MTKEIKVHVNLAPEIINLRVEDEVDYQMAMRAVTIISLMANSWQSWYDCMAFDVMIEHLLGRINQKSVKECLRIIYQHVVAEIAQQLAGSDGYEMVHDMLKWKVCPLCGQEGTCKN